MKVKKTPSKMKKKKKQRKASAAPSTIADYKKEGPQLKLKRAK